MFLVQKKAVQKTKTFGVHKNPSHNFFGIMIPAISKHIENIFEKGELRKEKVAVSKMEITTRHAAIKSKMQTLLSIHYILAFFLRKQIL